MTAGLIAGGSILLQAIIWPEFLPFYAGMALGAGAALYVALIESPPEWIERKRRGRDAERRTARRLEKLEKDGWAAAHDIVSSRGNFDHLLVGPQGAFLLETKDFHGAAVIEDGRLVLQRGDDDRDSWWPVRPIDAGVRQAAVEARQRLNRATGITWVQGVIVLWSDFPQRVAELDRVFVVHGDHLAEWLRARPTRLAPEVVERARDHLHALELYEVEREKLVA